MLVSSHLSVSPSPSPSPPISPNHKGYPDSVTEDYLPFQIYDTIQAVCSYLRGILCTTAGKARSKYGPPIPPPSNLTLHHCLSASHLSNSLSLISLSVCLSICLSICLSVPSFLPTVLVGLGVGDDHATAYSATLTWVLRDLTGMLASMTFAYCRASNFGHDVKKWRLFADVINDVGLTLELLSPLNADYFLLLACLGSICRALCGVAAGATRATLSSHFARTNNLSDISAKEGIQEVCMTLYQSHRHQHKVRNTILTVTTLFSLCLPPPPSPFACDTNNDDRLL
jgi:Vitamin B6 photo-protection and homoeostasis